MLNVADRLAKFAARSPDRVAVVCRRVARIRAGYATITFGELDADATRIARGLVDWGVTPGTRLALLVRPGIEFVTLVFALLRAGVVIVLVDPGLGRRNLVRCLAEAEPEGLSRFRWHRRFALLVRGKFPQAQVECHGRAALVLGRADARASCDVRGDAALATRSPAGNPRRRSGGDHLYLRQHGAAEGRALHAADVRHAGGRDSVDVRHRAGRRRSVLLSAVRAVQLGDGRDDGVAGHGFLAAGVGRSGKAARGGERLAGDAGVRVAGGVAKSRASTAEDGRADSSRCGRCFRAAHRCRPTCCDRRSHASRRMRKMHTPYGATECLPVATIEAAEVLSETAARTDEGAGVCVGRKFDSIEWRVIRITDEPIATIDDAEELPPGEIGELIVRGPQVSPRYVTRTECNAGSPRSPIGAGSRSGIAWATSAISTTPAASGTAAASRSASRRATGRCSPNASKRFSTRIRRCGARHLVGIGPRGDRRRS